MNFSLILSEIYRSQISLKLGNFTAARIENLMANQKPDGKLTTNALAILFILLLRFNLDPLLVTFLRIFQAR